MKFILLLFVLVILFYQNKIIENNGNTNVCQASNHLDSKDVKDDCNSKTTMRDCESVGSCKWSSHTSSSTSGDHSQATTDSSGSDITTGHTNVHHDVKSSVSAYTLFGPDDDMSFIVGITLGILALVIIVAIVVKST